METVRITEDIGKLSTESLLMQILIILNQKNRAQFFVPAGTGMAVVQRLRVKLSRTRKAMKRNGKRHKHFILKSNVIPWTGLDGKRQECIIMWEHVTSTHQTSQILEKLLDGQSLS